MSQDPFSTLAKCAKCKAGPGEECVTRGGAIAEKVHYGRPEWSKKTRAYRSVQMLLKHGDLTPEQRRAALADPMTWSQL